MKKITFLLIAMFCFAFTWQINAQHTFAPQGPVSVPGSTDVTLNFNNAANSAGVPAGIYTNFLVSVDWTDVNNAWSSEAELTISTAAGDVIISPPTSGAANTGAATTLTFVGVLAGDYDPSVDGTFNLVLYQTWTASVAQWNNITVTITGPPVTPDCATTPFPADGAVDVAIGNLTLTWSAPVSGPTPTGYNVYVYDDATGTNPFLIGTTTTTSLDVTTDTFGVEIFWAAISVNLTEEATGCAVWSFTIENIPPPPANNDCSGAVSLTPGATFDVNPMVGTINGASGSGELPLPGCAQYDPTDPSGFGGDVWYAVTVPADGNLTIETNGNPTGADGDSGMAVYTGTCGALVLFECNDDGSADGLYSLVSIDPADGLAGQTVYVRVWEYAGDDPLTFQVSAHSATLSIIDVENANAFTYFPNPVKNSLNLKAKNAIQNVSVYNMLGQEVLRTAPNSLNSEINTGSLQTGAYIVKVTINDAMETIRVIKQ